ncbi:hypothetical protein [Actinomadura sp. SCN-SB]|uniref:hypothetical protein n=1 Tax=Actinomadura sp. SCN-SB TaxID=3373092 RepID=UPI0037515711
MDVVETWTGWHANALLKAMRLTNETFAGRLGVAVRTVAKWNANPDMVLSPEMQQVLDTFLLREVPDDGKARFSLILSKNQSQGEAPHVRQTPRDELSALTAWIAESPSNRDAIEQIGRATQSLAYAHPHSPAKKILSEVLRLQQQTQSILESGRHRLRETRDLLKVNSDLLAHACLLLGDINDDQRAEQYGLAALMFAQEAEASEDHIWYARSKTARWQDRYIESADLAWQGFERSTPGPMRVQLAWYEASAAALLGDHNRAREASRRAEEAAGNWLTTNAPPSAWSFTAERQAVFAQSVAIRTRDADGALRAAAMADAGWAAGDPKVLPTWAQIRVGAGIGHLMKGSLEAAIAEVTPMLTLEPELRLATVTRHLANLDQLLRRHPYKNNAAANGLREAIREFNSEALKAEDDPTEDQ